MQPDEFFLKIAYAIIAFMLIVSIVMISVIFFGPDNIVEQFFENMIESNSGLTIDLTPYENTQIP